ncbi:polysaccharide biosynthesis tyrosine autokinase [Zobellia galactanivorans]|uniref:GumC family protein n=1 Tax=Zobellia galactanivorans (strain DSM 12802 / CCUG 47099 / CIP 106680 / NCIMB 13871 / Dsij) TaxID=63186 RepID=UPI0026E38982|nr:tyrosine-protein kinase family protein [Zobellia galactanivorans]MDO6807540.1 polysaccharide biosynthesis tyrosine autokinase [Zobellia galactanivorans]
MSLNTQNPLPNNSFDIKEILNTYTAYAKWFVLSVLVALVVAYTYIRYATPQYAVQAQIQILEDKTSGSELDVFKDLSLFGGGKNKVEDELQLIRSRSNFIRVVKELNLNTKILVQGNIKETELYKNPPVNINFIAADSILNRANLNFFITISSSTTFGYTEEEDKPVKIFAFGKNISTPIGDIVITPNVGVFESYKNKKLRISVKPIEDVAQGYRTRVVVSNPGELSNIVNLTLEDPIREKAVHILDALVRIYNENAIEDKQIIADRTSNFIDERIANISSDLASVDQSAQDFKTEKGVTDIAAEASVNLNVGVANQQELANARNQLNIAASMQDLVQQQDSYEVLPTNVGLSDPTIASTTDRYNQLVLERKRLLKSSNEKNPVIVNLDQQIAGLKRSMQSSLSSTVNNLGLTVNSLSGQQARFNSKIYSSPANERALRDITRQQQTTESLYLYLLQKREEAQISAASSSPKSKVVDKAYSISKLPVSPKKSIIYLASFILGLLVPFSIIYAKELLDNKVHNMHSLEKVVKNVPILGELPRLSKKEEKFVVKEDRSVLAESLRIIRTNLDYLIKSKKKKEGKSNIIFVTSSVPGEGKTFLSTNLSMILASTNKKVLLLGADIRNPKLYTFFSGGGDIDKMKKPSRNKDAGLTEYLYDNTIELRDIVNPMLVHRNTIDVIYSGRIPPNPAELLMSDRVNDLFSKVSENYDYVIVDTAPLMVVTDTLLISEFADLLLYVTRAGVTETKAVEYPIKLQEEGKIKGLSFVVNDVDASNLGYGGKYGYGYGQTQKKWWKF